MLGHPLIDDRAGDGVFRVHRDVFRDEALFAREMRTFFEHGWVFLAHASQLPRPHDFLTLRLGRMPLVLMRDGQGQLHCFHNSCRHKGAMVCHQRQGNRRTHVCQYHGWAYASNGSNLLVKAKAQGDYMPAFDAESHALQPVRHFAEYRGFLFAALGDSVPTLDEHLGDVRTLIDMVVDQSPEGLELVPGAVTYTYEGNWKLQLENSTDAITSPPHIRHTCSCWTGARARRSAATWCARSGRPM